MRDEITENNWLGGSELIQNLILLGGKYFS